MINYEFPPIGGGGGNANFAILKEFAGRKDLNIDLLTSASQPGLFLEHFADNIKIHKIGIHKKQLHYWRKTEVIEWLLKAGWYHKKLVRNYNYDLVHAFFGFPSGWLCLKTAKKIPYIISLRGSDVPGYNTRLKTEYKILSPVFARIWNNAAMVIANSQGLCELARKFTPDIDISVIPNGVDISRFKNKPAAPNLKKVKLITVCRLIDRKRIDLIIKAVRILNDIGCNVELDIAGDGVLKKSLYDLASKLGAVDKINFLGLIESDHISQVYKSNDIFVMASRHEGMSNAMLEAMASGLPIITTPCEGTKELIDGNGIIVNDPILDSIAQAVIKLASDQKLYQQMSSKSQSQAGLFSWACTANKYKDCYLKTISEGAGI